MTKIKRRQFLKILAFSAAGAAAYQFGRSPRLARLREVSASRFLMGTLLNLTVIAEDETAAEIAVAATLDQMNALEAILSRHQPASQLSQLNSAGILSHPSPHLLAVLQQAQAISEQSNGAFDVTVKPLLDLYQQAQKRGRLPSQAAVSALLPLVDYRQIEIAPQQLALAQPGMAISLDGIAKGYIVDQGTQVLRTHGLSNVLVEAGGDLLAVGRNQRENPWQIGIQAPRSGGPHLLAQFGIQDQAVATSGDYMQPYSADFRHHHILDPRSGYSQPDLASATVIAPTAMLADGLATAVMAMNAVPAREFLRRFPNTEGYLVTKTDLTISTAAGLAEP